MTQTISGNTQVWQIGDNKPRKYINLQTNYGTLRKLCTVDVYDGQKGEQRAVNKPWAQKLKNEVKSGKFSPSVFYASVIDDKDVTTDGKKSIIKANDNVLALTDGSHRRAVLEELRGTYVNARVIDNLPVTIMVNLEAENRVHDFLKYNAGKQVDATHMLNLQIDIGEVGDPEVYEMARDMAKELHSHINSHLNNQVKMFSDGTAPLTLKSMITNHKSEQPASLYGTAMICKQNNKDFQWGVDHVVEAWQILVDSNENLVGPNGVLCPPPNGKKRPASLIIGLANALAYRNFLLKQEKSTDEDIEIFSRAADTVFGELDNLPSLDGQRRLLGNFVDELFSDVREKSDLGEIDIPTGFHDGLPISLGQLFSMASYGREALPRISKSKGRKKKGDVQKLVIIESTVESPVESVESESLNTQGSESDTMDEFNDSASDVSIDDVDSEDVFA